MGLRRVAGAGVELPAPLSLQDLALKRPSTPWDRGTDVSTMGHLGRGVVAFALILRLEGF
jgi:hypothetical protein